MKHIVVVSILLLAAVQVGSAEADARPVEAQQGWLGVVTEDLSPAMRAALGIERGVLVAEVLEDGPAGKAGIRTGDVVLRLDDEVIAGGDDLRAAVRVRAGKSVSVAVWRQGETRSVKVTLGTRDPSRLEQYLGLHPIPTTTVRTLRKALSDVGPRLEGIVESERPLLDSLRVEIEELRRELRELREQLRQNKRQN